MSRPQLSVCMIARNEADILGMCLESLKGLADEVVVVDTGSTDDTVQIAAAYGARVVESVWRDDFSLARNESLQLASGEWILVLDADEILSAADHDAIREVMNGPRDCAYVLVQRNYTTHTNVAGWKPNDGACVEAAAYPGFVPAVQFRLIPADPRVEFTGAVHEDMGDSLLALGLRTETLEIPIHHFGKVRSQAVMERKKRLYTQLGEDKLRTAPNSPQAMFELGVQYIEIGKRPEAIATLETFLQSESHPYFHSRAVGFLGQMYTFEGRHEEAIAVLEDGVREHPDSIVLRESLAWARIRNGQAFAAVKVLDEALSYWPEQLSLLELLGLQYVDLRQFDAAATIFARASAIYPDSASVKRGLAVMDLATHGADVAAEVAGRLTSASSAATAQNLILVVNALVEQSRGDVALRLLLTADPNLRSRLMAAWVRTARAANRRDEESWAMAQMARRSEMAVGDLEASLPRLMVPGSMGTAFALIEMGADQGHPSSSLARAGVLSRWGCGAWARECLANLQSDPRLGSIIDQARSRLQTSST